MYSVIRRTNFGSVFYFVSWVVLGKYTFLTLFLAVTLEAFESKYDVEASSEAYLAYKSTPYNSLQPSLLLVKENHTQIRSCSSANTIKHTMQISNNIVFLGTVWGFIEFVIVPLVSFPSTYSWVAGSFCCFRKGCLSSAYLYL